MSSAIASLPTFDPESGDLLAVVETPKGSRNKYSFNRAFEVFELRRVLPRGMQFPYDFGFIPATAAEDGDPLDVLLLLEDPAPTGCVIRIHAIGAIEARQREGGGAWSRNDRVLAVAKQARLQAHLRDADQLDPRLLDEIEAFFRQYNQMDGKEFEPLRRGGAETARALIHKGQEKAQGALRRRLGPSPAD